MTNHIPRAIPPSHRWPTKQPNLDRLDRFALAEFIASEGSSQPGSMSFYWHARHFARARLALLEAEIDGDLDLAASLEEKCDRLYDNLPAFARW